MNGAPGLVLAGKYELLQEIGQGGMGSVWRANRLDWRAPVAVKLLRLPDAPRASERFQREVRLAAALRSQHVVQVLDHGIDDATRVPFIVMELLEGESLAATLRTLGRLPPARVFTIATHLGRALSRAHQSGIVHRDLKPDNIFLVPNGDETVAKVLDFGVARAFELQLDSSPVTSEGRTVGTPFYMSPEQMRGKNLDFRLDLWSLATIVCECLTGKRAFQAASLNALAALLCGSEPRPVPSALGPVPLGFDAWFARATHADISARFQSAEELVDQLRPICLPGSAGAASPAPPLTRGALEAPTASVEAPTIGALSRTYESVVPRFLRGPRLLVAVGAGVALGLLGTASVRHWSSPPGTVTTGVGAARPAPTPPPAPGAPLAAPVPPEVGAPAPVEPAPSRPFAPPEPRTAPPPAAATAPAALPAPEATPAPKPQRARRPLPKARKKVERQRREADSTSVDANGRFIRGDL